MEMLRENQGSIENGIAPKVLLDYNYGILANASLKLFVRLKIKMKNCFVCNSSVFPILKIVPYRDSKLTHLFKNFFDGEGKVC